MTELLQKYLYELSPLYTLPDAKGHWRTVDYKQLSSDLKSLLNERWQIEDGLTVHWSVFKRQEGKKKRISRKSKSTIEALKILSENADLIRKKLLEEYRRETSQRKQAIILEKLLNYWIKCSS